RLDLEELPPGAAALELPCPPGCREEQVGQSVSPVLVLPPAGRSVVATLTPKNRRSLALARNRAARIGGVEFGAARESEAQTFLDMLFRLHAACWKARGEPGVLAAPELQRFHRS